MKIIKTNSAILATIVVIIFITTITIVADLSPLFKGWLKETFGHHWIAKGVLATLLWVVIAAIPIKLDIVKPKLLLTTLVSGILAITIFYTILYLF